MMIWIYVLLITVGFLPFFVVLYKIKKQKWMKKDGIKASATVVQVPLGFRKGINRVTIEYLVKETGLVISKNIGVAGVPYNVGDQLPMYYNRQNPAKMIMDAGKNFIFLLVFTLILAAFFIAVCFFINKSIGSMEVY